MISTTQFEELLQSRETPILDFKGRMYEDLPRNKLNDFSNPRGTNGKGYLDLVKDVLAMSNTPRMQSAFIVLGVISKPNAANIRKGITEQIDDNHIQHHLKLWCDPVPAVHYYDVKYQGENFGIIEILMDRNRGPYFIKSDLLSVQETILQSEGRFLEQNTIYFRRGTTNDFARPVDAAYISEWFAAHRDDYWQNWETFKQACHYFVPSRHYILITSPTNSFAPDTLVGLNHIDWTAVIDFDSQSDTQGLLSGFAQSIQKRNITRVVKGETPPINTRLGLYWFFAQGLQGRQQTLVTPSNDWRRWKTSYGGELERHFKRLAEAITPDLVTFVILWYDPSLMRFLQTTVDATTAFTHAEFVVVSDANAAIESAVGQEFSPAFFNISLAHLSSGLRVEFLGPDQENAEQHTLPSLSGAPIILPIEKERWLEEELEVVHLGVGSSSVSQDDLSQEFLRGAVVSWVELSLGKDAEREKTQKIEQRIRQDLSKRETVRIQLYHRPGAGGTTVARRILWNLHTLYPCVVLHRSDPEHISDTAERLAYIYGITGQPVLLLIDSAQIAERLVDDLFNIVRSKGTPVVMLLASRRFDPQTERNRSFQLDLILTNIELPRFVEKYRNQIPERASQITAILNTAHNHEKTAFNFGITAYGKDFKGLENYVSARLSSLTYDQKQILVFLAFAHYYGQRGIPAQAFSELLGIPMNREVRFEQVFQSAEPSLDILIQEDGSWRTVHYLIAEEILEQALAPAGGDRRTWKQQLSIWAKRFIAFCRGSYDVISEEMIELVRRTFVYRDNLDLLGRETPTGIASFSKLSQDIPSPEGRLEVFRSLTEHYPEEAHFWAHLGRFLAAVMKNYDEALKANQQAINLQSDDHVLWHMQGMIYRYQVQGLIETNSNLNEIVELAQQSSECFAESRRLNPDDEHAYISEIQLIIRVLNYAGRQTNGNVMQYIRQIQIPSYLRDAFEKAESLLSQVRSNREGEGSSPYEQSCRADLHKLYGDPQQALQIWDNLLARSDIYRPSIPLKALGI